MFFISSVNWVWLQHVILKAIVKLICIVVHGRMSWYVRVSDNWASHKIHIKTDDFECCCSETIAFDTWHIDILLSIRISDPSACFQKIRCSVINSTWLNYSANSLFEQDSSYYWSVLIVRLISCQQLSKWLQIVFQQLALCFELPLNNITSHSKLQLFLYRNSLSAREHLLLTKINRFSKH